MEPIIPGITFVPRYVRQVSDMEYGSVVSHENYNEKLNLNSSQGDYNTEILNLLFTEEDPSKTPHIPYVEKIISDELTELSTAYDDLQEQIDTHTDQITGINTSLLDARQAIQQIILGPTVTARASKADAITGIENAGRHRYYGTNYSNQIGFHEMPDSLYARDLREAGQYVTDLIITPPDDSVTEAMLVEDVRTKLNRVSITDYNQLTHLPSINSVQLTGNKSLSDLGIQPVGSYLTSVPDTYALKTYVDAAVSPKLDSSTAASTYATITALQTLEGKVPDGLATVVNTYIRVGINQPVSNPRTGDLYITV